MRCDHTVDADVEALVERVRAERGGLDLLVNNVWGGYEGQALGIPMTPFWEQPRRAMGDDVCGRRDGRIWLMSQLAAPLMIGHGGGLIVCTWRGRMTSICGTYVTTYRRRPSCGWCGGWRTSCGRMA